jgi:hypothetical protein
MNPDTGSPVREAINTLLADLDFQRLHTTVEKKSTFDLLRIDTREQLHQANESRGEASGLHFATASKQSLTTAKGEDKWQ